MSESGLAFVTVVVLASAPVVASAADAAPIASPDSVRAVGIADESRRRPSEDRLRLVAADGVALSAGFYRTTSGRSAVASVETEAPLGAVLIAGPGEADTMHAALGRALAEAGIPALALSLRGHGSGTGSRREDPGAYWRDGVAAVRAMEDSLRLPPERVVLIGEGAGAWVAIWAGSRMSRPPAAFVLLEPQVTSERVEGIPILRGLERPTLVVASEESFTAREAARTIFVDGTFACDFWQVAGASRRSESVWRRTATAERFGADAAEWLRAHVDEEGTP